jgi:hypothetical protein
MLSQARTLTLVILGALVASAAACSWPSSAKAPGDASRPAAKPATAPASATRPKPQVLVVRGLVVSMSAPPSGATTPPAGGYQILLRAKNSTEATISLPVIGNPPRMLDRSGNPIAGVIAGTGFGPGARRQNDLQRSARDLRPRPGANEGLPAGAYVTGVLSTKFNPAGHNYQIKWDFGEGRVATFQLP